MMNKRTIFVVLASVALALSAIAVIGPTVIGSSDAVVYKLTFEKFELQDDAGVWHVVNDTPATVDIASANPGALAQSIVGAAASLPAGHYKAFRSTVSGTMTIKGYWFDGLGMVYYTTANKQAVSAPPGQSPDGFGIVVGVFAGTEAQFLAGLPGDYAEGSIRPPTVETSFVGASDTEDLTVTGGVDSPVDEELVVDLTGTIQVWDLNGDGVGDVIFPGTPMITVP